MKARAAKDKTTIVLIGHASVDSGHILIIDPCYLKGWKQGKGLLDDGGHCREICDLAPYGEISIPGLSASESGVGIASSGGIGVASETNGDGNYPVYARMEGDRVKSLTIQF